MSVINQMLRDLEHRRAQGFEQQDSILKSVHLPGIDETAGGRKIMVWLLLFVLAIAVAYLLWERTGMTVSQSQPVATSPVAIHSAESRPEKPADNRQPASAPVVEMAAPVVESATAKQEEVRPEAPGVAQFPTTASPLPTDPDVDQAPVIVAATGVPEQVENTSSSMAAIESPPARYSSATVEQTVKPGPADPAPIVATELVEPRQWLDSRQQPYTVQLMSDASASRLMEIAHRLALTDAAVIPTFGSRQWYILVQGEFASMDDALVHLGRIPAELKSAKPFPRGIETIALNDTLREQPAHAQQDTTAVPATPAATESTVAPPRNTAPAVTKKVRPETAAQTTERMYQTAINEIRAGRQIKAAETLQGVLAIMPQHQAAREALAGVLVDTGRSTDAIALMREGLTVDPAASSFAKLLAQLLINRDEQQAAIQVLENHRPTLAADPDYHAMLAALYQRSQRNAEAAALYRQLVQAYPNMAVWWIGYGIASEANNNRGQALQAFRRASELPGLSQQMRQFVDQRLASLARN